MHETYQATATTNYRSAAVPTLYFIGVTTASSAIRRIFPLWAAKLGLGGEDEVKLVGIDFKLHDEPAAYRRAIEFIRHDPLSLGALVTSHKIDVLNACRKAFDTLDPFAVMLDEVVSISKQKDKLIGRAFDPVTCGLAMDAFLQPAHWRDTGGHLLILGAGGAGMATVARLIGRPVKDRPTRIIVADRDARRLGQVTMLCTRLDVELAGTLQDVQAKSAADNDACVAALPPHSLIINATGMGKDLPGSPLTDDVVFPEQSIAWDYNYRGELRFLAQAHAQAATRQVRTEDGWIYFLHGWLHVIGDVFGIDVPTRGPLFDELSRVARELR